MKPSRYQRPNLGPRPANFETDPTQVQDSQNDALGLESTREAIPDEATAVGERPSGLLSPFADTVRRDPRATIIPTRRVSEAAAEGALLSLAHLISSGHHDIGHRIVTGELIGKGGMGMVHRARHVALNREVAVKVLQPDKRSPQSTVELLQEAWVTGALEHPNVVPVYDLGVDDEGNPTILFKRIDGVTWTNLMADGAEVEGRFGTRDLLGWNLGILMQVLNAVRYAHSRGIIHRDLKPDNVMVGEFGEVYILDWGIAVSTVKPNRGDGNDGNDGHGGNGYDDGGVGAACNHGGEGDDVVGLPVQLPLAEEATELAGTPCYMAPEMLGGEGPGVSERTDIYLLGATLYEILSGKPPHKGTTLLEIYRSVAASDPPLPPTAPVGLAHICRRAMQLDPERRFESAEEMRRALQEFLQHRGSAELADQAVQRLQSLLQLLRRASTEQKSGSDAMADSERRQQIYRLYGACRFGFLQALETWSDNAQAAAKLTEATTAMVKYELTQGDPRAASALLVDLPESCSVSEHLAARVATALNEKRAEEARLLAIEERERARDPYVGSRVRVIVTAAMSLSWILLPLAVALLRPVSTMHPPHGNMVMGSLFLAALVVGAALVARKSIVASAINRRLVTVAGCMLLGQATLHFGASIAGIAPAMSQIYQLFYWAAVTACLAITMEWRLFPTSIAYLLVYLCASAWPDMRFIGMALANTAFLINAMAVWLPAMRHDRRTPRSLV